MKESKTFFELKQDLAGNFSGNGDDIVSSRGNRVQTAFTETKKCFNNMHGRSVMNFDTN